MKIFLNEASWGEKLNIIDENNVLVGYDFSGQCCEHYGFYVLDQPENFSDAVNQEGSIESLNEELKDYKFDPSFHETKSEGYEGCIGVFRAVCEGKPDKFICLFNYHNGYYGHGFDMSQGETILFKGCL